MIKDPWALFNFLIPNSDQPAEISRWRSKVAFSITILSMTVFLAAPLVLETRYAIAQEQVEIHNQISSEISGVKEALEDLNATVRRTAEQQARIEKEKSIRDVRQQIYETQREACLQSGQLRVVLLQQVAALRSDYMALTGIEYPELNCGNFK